MTEGATRTPQTTSSAAVSRYTEEIAGLSTPAIEMRLRRQIRDDMRMLRDTYPELFSEIDAERKRNP